MHYLLNGIFPAVKFEACIIYTFRVIAESRFFLYFHCFVSIATIFWFIMKKSDVHYLLIGIYPAVKFQMCSLNTF